MLCYDITLLVRLDQESGCPLHPVICQITDKRTAGLLLEDGGKIRVRNSQEFTDTVQGQIFIRIIIAYILPGFGDKGLGRTASGPAADAHERQS